MGMVTGGGISAKWWCPRVVSMDGRDAFCIRNLQQKYTVTSMEEVRHWTYLGLIPNAFMMNDVHLHHCTQRPAWYLILVIRNPDSIFRYFSLTHFWNVIHCVSMSVRKDYCRHQHHEVCEWTILSTFHLYSSQVPTVSDYILFMSFDYYNLLHENNFVVWFTFPGPILRTMPD